MDATSLIATFAAGLALGGAYMAALWLTVRRLQRTRHQALWLVGSAALRLAALFLALFWIMDGHWLRLLVCFLGFLAGRFIVVGWARRIAPGRAAPPAG